MGSSRKVIISAALGLWLVPAVSLAQQSDAPVSMFTVSNGSTADHAEFEILQKEFTSGEEVTEACLSCHTEASDQVMHSIHYTWNYENPETGQTLGKSNVINSFCGSVVGNEPRCTSCHAGYGWEDMNSPPPQQETAVDCLVCHDNSGQYTKTATEAGHPPLDPVPDNAKTITGAKAWPVDLTKAAQSVGPPTRENCGQCHFYGGGGDNVKHGDLSSALYNPTKQVDVHMDAEGLNFTCSTCHVSESHEWAGSRYNMTLEDPHADLPGARRDVATCDSCHGTKPHDATTVSGWKLNDHTDTIACQTCHIPEFAKGGVATKTRWDWSTAGKMDADGHPMHENNFTQSDGKELHTYLATKGDFEYGEDVTPYYAWFNGQIEYTTQDRKIDPTKTVEVNIIHGDAGDGKSKIYPFKRMEGRQAYDTELNQLVYTHVWGPGDDTAFWTGYDWQSAIETGMKAAGAEFSGSYGFVDTYMYWPTTHMVAPKDEALECDSCHTDNGRMDGIDGVYMPGKEPWNLAGIAGLALLLATLAGVLGHGALRLITRKNGGDHV